MISELFGAEFKTTAFLPGDLAAVDDVEPKGEHYDKVVCDEIVKAPLVKVWNCVYRENKDFMMAFLKDNQKVQGTFDT